MSLLEQAKIAELEVSKRLAGNNPSEALTYCIQAVELYMQARKQSLDATHKKFLAKKCRDLMKWGDEIKVLKKQKEDQALTDSTAKLSVNDGSSSQTAIVQPEPFSASPSVSMLLPPISKRSLTTREQMIVLMSAKLPPHVFPPWTSPPVDSEFAVTDELFSDKGGLLPLSEIQQVNLDAWRRVRDIWCGKETMSIKLDHPSKPLDLSQDVITDCSIVASLCAALEREQRGLGNIVTDKIWPQSAGVPIVSPNGKYVIKLWFNGCYRKVVIDDLLPTAQTSSPHTLYVTVNNCASYLPPCLLEKAYLKAMGGYDFPGSNSGTDLMCFTGWIPEHLFLQSHNSDHTFQVIDQERLWERVHKAWGYGDVLVTLGTGDPKQLDGTGLVGEHDYAVVGMKEIKNKKNGMDKWWLVKNPWKEGGIWKGLRRRKRVLYPDEDSESNSSDESDSEQESLDDSDTSSGEVDFDNPIPGSRLPIWEQYTPKGLPPITSKSTFWIDLPNVYRHFESIYLNWNPSLWLNRYDYHFSWDQTLPNPKTTYASTVQSLWSVPTCFWANPQYQISNPSQIEIEVWVLVSRHLVPSTNSDPTQRVGWVRSGHISLYLFAAEGNRVHQSSGFLQRGPYVDSPQTLLRFKIPPKTSYTTVVSSQDLLPKNYSHPFSISAFSRTPIAFSLANDLYPHISTYHSAWTALTAGGSKECNDYDQNPMYKLTLPHATSLIIGLSTSSPEIYIQIALLHSGGQRVYTVTHNQILADSGEYIRHHTVLRAPLVPAGTYTIVVSTFKPDRLAPFTLTVGSDRSDTSVTPIKAEDAGLYKRTLHGKWPEGGKKMMYRLKISRLSQAKIKVVDFNKCWLRFGVWEQHTQRWVAGGWGEDDSAGFMEGKGRLDGVDLRSDREVGGTWIVVERRGEESIGGNVNSGWEVTVLSDNVVDILQEGA